MGVLELGRELVPSSPGSSSPGPSSQDHLRRARDLLRGRLPEVSASGFAGGVLAAGAEGLGWWRLPDGGEMWAAADCLLFNRQELAKALEVEVDSSPDWLLLLLGYRRWGAALVDRLDGDFAFVVLEPAKGELFAARDPFGVRPFFFQEEGRRLLFGSEPKLVRGLLERPGGPDREVIAEFLFRRFYSPSRTFFEGLQRLPPGHCLRWGEGGLEIRRFWWPERRTLPRIPPGEALETFTAALRESVRKRLAARPRLGLQLSGGLDSSSVAVLAGQLIAEGKVKPQVLHWWSLIFPDLPCDESPYIDAVARQLPFTGRAEAPVYDMPTESVAAALRWLDSPFLDPQRWMIEGPGVFLKSFGGDLLLTGFGGDEVTHEENHLRDLVREGRLRQAVAEARLGSEYSSNSAWDLLRDALKEWVPGPAKSSYWWLKRCQQQIWSYRWVQPEMRRLFFHGPPTPEPPRLGLESLTQESIFLYLNHPQLGWALDALDFRAVRWGYRMTHPFLDRRVVEVALSLRPAERRFEGPWKWLLRQGLRDLLPEEVRDRRRKTVLDPYNQRALAGALPDLYRRLLVEDGSWESEPFVARRQAVRWFRRGLDPGASLKAQEICWRIACLELWLRGFAPGGAGKFQMS